LPEPIFDPEHKPSQNRAADQQRPNPTALCGPYAVDVLCASNCFLNGDIDIAKRA
jgi:hypothetical protein